MSSNNYVSGNDVATFVLQTDAPYKILDFDQGLCTMTGYSPRELSKKFCTLDSLLFVEDFADTIASINYQLSISNLISVQHRIVTKKGNLLTVLCNGQAFTLNDGRDVLQCVFTDITNLESAANETAKAKTDLEIFANTVPSGVSKHLLDNKLTLLWANNYFYNISGHTQEDYNENKNANMLSHIYNEDLASVIDILADLTEDSTSKIIDFRLKCKNGSLKWVNAVLARSGEEKDGFPVVNLVLSDITNLKIAEMKARLEEQKYLIISDISEELPYEYDILEDVITFADKFSNIFDTAAIIANPAVNLVESTLVSQDTREALGKLISMAKTGIEYYSAEFKLNTKGNGYQWYFSNCSTIYDENLNPIRTVGLLRNIHEQKIEQEKLLLKSETDLMTGLFNKTTTENKIKASLRELDGNNYNVLMLIDIDDFKKINDTYGHLKGDEVIVNIAKAMMEFAGDYGVPGRLGGDEFCLFLSNVLDIQLACEKATFIADRIRSIYSGENDTIKVTLSIGIAQTAEQIPYSVLLENADTALYQAKLNGKNCYFRYEENMERGKYENNRSSATNSEDKSNQLVQELFNTLFSATNTYAAIEKSLDLIGTTYGIDKICIWEYGFDKNFVDCSHQWCKKGIKNDIDVKKHTPSAVFEEIDAMETDGFSYSSDTTTLKLNQASMNPKNDGITRFVQSNIKLNGKVIGYIGFYVMNKKTKWSTNDLSDFKLIFKILGEAVCSKQNQNNLSMMREDTIKAFDMLPNPMIVVDRDSYDIMYFNEAAGEYYPRISLNNKCYASMYLENNPCRDCPIHRVKDDVERASCTKTLRETDEPIDEIISPIKWNTGTNNFVIAASPHKQTKSERIKHEIEQSISIEKQLTEASYRDIITGFGNFEKFKLDAQEILNKNPDTDYVMFYFNIKNFKFINETYGHSIGDSILKTVATVMAKYTADGEAFARMISDTYIMLIQARSKESYMNTLENIRTEVHDTCRTIQDRFAIDFIAGILVIDETMHTYSINRLVDRAIMAGKSINSATGATYAFYDDEYHKKVLNDAQLENSMHDALANKEFCAYVQPKYDIVTNKLIGGEFLVRWLSPSKGFLEPAAFIPSFEKNGFIYQIDLFMLEEACKSLRKYLDTNARLLPFSVNLSRVTLAHLDFIDKVKDIAEKYDIPHHYIEFEITESVFSENYEQMIDVLTKLRDMDFTINMDDFGTGYSSLTLLKDLPLDIIKLDHDFLSRSVANDQSAIAILKSIIDMAHTLGIRVVSEGVESAEQLEMLRSIGCEIGQGFLFAKPMPVEDYDALIGKHSDN